MRSIDDLDTPAILIDASRAEANIKRAQAHADRHGLKLRPHIKTHKLPYWAKKQVAAGAVGITCQKIGEAEVMADAGLADIFLPYNILGRAKLERLKALHGRVTLSVTADSRETLAGYADDFHRCRPSAAGAGRMRYRHGPLRGATADEAVALARRDRQGPGLRFGGLMTYPPAGRPAQAEAWLARGPTSLAAAGIACERSPAAARPICGAGRGQRRHRAPARHLHLPRPLPGREGRRQPRRLRADGAGDGGQPPDAGAGNTRRRQQGALQRHAGDWRISVSCWAFRAPGSRV